MQAVAPLDATALFHDLAVGADAAASSIVAVLAAADALSHTNMDTFPNRVAFGLFQGEAYGRIGSRRFVQELQQFTCTDTVSATDSPTGFAYCRNPLRPDTAFTEVSMHAVVAADQVGRTPLFVHGSGTVAAAVTAAVPGSAAPASPATMPPTPLASFASSLPGAVLAGYDDAYASRYFHSQFDDSSNVSPTAVSTAALVLARSLYTVASGTGAAPPSSLAVDADLVDDLLYCLAGNASCGLVSDVVGGGGTLTGPFSLYTGVYNQPFATGKFGFGLSPTLLELFVRSFLANVTAVSGQHGAVAGEGDSCTSSSGCKEQDSRLECVRGVCIIPTAHYHDAYSVALNATGSYNDFVVDASKVDAALDPLWTEPLCVGTRG